MLEIVFRNNLNTSTNIVPSGATTNSTAATEPGQTQIYEWRIGQDVRAKPHFSMPQKAGGVHVKLFECARLGSQPALHHPFNLIAFAIALGSRPGAVTGKSSLANLFGPRNQPHVSCAYVRPPITWWSELRARKHSLGMRQARGKWRERSARF